MNGSCGDEACEELVVPGGDLSAEATGIFAGGFSDQVQRHVLDGGEVGWGVVGTLPAVVVAEDHVHEPVRTVFDGPMSADDRSGQPFNPTHPHPHPHRSNQGRTSC